LRRVFRSRAGMLASDRVVRAVDGVSFALPAGSNSHFVFLSMAGLCGIFGGTMGGVRAGQRSRRYWWRLREGESEQQVVP
jgi:hypothetical protein